MDKSVFYLTGRYMGMGMIMKFNKLNARLKWYARLYEMTTIRAWAQVPNDRYFYACGDYFNNGSRADKVNTKYSAAAFRMKNDGEMMWY